MSKLVSCLCPGTYPRVETFIGAFILCRLLLVGALAQPTPFLELLKIIDLNECAVNVGAHVYLACNREGVLFLSDAENRRVLHLTDGGCFHPLELKAHGVLRPHGIAFDKDGCLYVANPDMHEVLVFDRYGELGRVLGGFDSEFSRPEDLAITEEGTLYVLDTERNAVVVLEPTGEVKGLISLASRIGRPLSIALHDKGIFILVDGRPNILMLDQEGHALHWLGEEGYEVGQLKVPVDITCSRNLLYVLDFLNNAIQTYDEDGNFIREHVLYKYLLRSPLALCVCNKKLYVVNATDQVLEFAIRYATTGIEHSLLGEELFALGYYQQAIGEFKKAIDLGYASAEVFFSLGLSYYLLGSYEDAKRELEKAWEREPDDIAVIFQLANAFYKTGEYIQAVDLYKLVLKHEPQHLQALYNLGKAYLKLGKLDEAVSQFRSALNLFSDFVDALIELGAIYLRKGSLEEAEEIFERALTKAPTDGRALYLMGMVRFQQEQYSEAAKFFEKSSSLGPWFIDSLYHLGLSYIKLGEKEKAIQCFERVLEIDPSHKEVQRRLEEIGRQK